MWNWDYIFLTCKYVCVCYNHFKKTMNDGKWLNQCDTIKLIASGTYIRFVSKRYLSNLSDDCYNYSLLTQIFRTLSVTTNLRRCISIWFVEPKRNDRSQRFMPCDLCVCVCSSSFLNAFAVVSFLETMLGVVMLHVIEWMCCSVYVAYLYCLPEWLQWILRGWDGWLSTYIGRHIGFSLRFWSNCM